VESGHSVCHCPDSTDSFVFPDGFSQSSIFLEPFSATNPAGFGAGTYRNTSPAGASSHMDADTIPHSGLFPHSTPDGNTDRADHCDYWHAH
jgi:hypothetical protein